MGCLLGRGRRKQTDEECQSSEQQQRTVDKYTRLERWLLAPSPVTSLLSRRITPSQEQNDDEYVFEKLVHVTVGKVPGQINGEDFAIDDCKVKFILTFSLTESHFSSLICAVYRMLTCSYLITHLW